MAACILLAAASAAGAQETSGAYVGAALGRLEHDEHDGPASELEDAGRTQRIFGGYRAAKHFAIEAAWTASGKLHDPAGVAFPAFPNADLESEYEILAIKGVAVWPIRRFAIFHGLGYFDSDTDLSITQNGVTLARVHEGESGGLVFGGVAYDLDRLTLRAETEWHSNVNGAGVTTTLIEVLFRF